VVFVVCHDAEQVLDGLNHGFEDLNPVATLNNVGRAHGQSAENCLPHSFSKHLGVGGNGCPSCFGAEFCVPSRDDNEALGFHTLPKLFRPAHHVSKHFCHFRVLNANGLGDASNSGVTGFHKSSESIFVMIVAHGFLI